MSYFSLIGAIIIVFGLYSVVWGKSKEQNLTSDGKVTAQELPVVWGSINTSSGNFVEDVSEGPKGKPNGTLKKCQIEDP